MITIHPVWDMYTAQEEDPNADTQAGRYSYMSFNGRCRLTNTLNKRQMSPVGQGWQAGQKHTKVCLQLLQSTTAHVQKVI